MIYSDHRECMALLDSAGIYLILDGTLIARNIGLIISQHAHRFFRQIEPRGFIQRNLSPTRLRHHRRLQNLRQHPRLLLWQRSHQ